MFYNILPLKKVHHLINTVSKEKRYFINKKHNESSKNNRKWKTDKLYFPIQQTTETTPKFFFIVVNKSLIIEVTVS